MILLTKKLFYKNVDKQIEKLLEIFWDISKDKHKFDIKNCISRIAGQEITMKLQNMVNCMEF